MTDVLIYYEAGGDYGMGHFVRCKHLGNALREAGIMVLFVSQDDQTLNQLDEAGYLVAPGGLGQVRELRQPIIVIDRMENRDDELKRLKQWRKQQLIVMVGAGHTITWQTHWIADAVIYQAPVGDWAKDVPGERVIQGLENIVVDPRYAEPVDPLGEERDLDFVTYFGAGANGDYRSRCIQVLLASGASVHDLTSNWAHDPMPVFRRARRFVGTMGMVAYDAMANGLRPILISRDADHLQPATMLHNEGLALSVGLLARRTPEYLAEFAFSTLSSPWPAFDQSVDGIGAYRVAKIIRDMLG